METLRNYLQASRAAKETPVRDASQIGNRLHEVFDRLAAQSAMKGCAKKLSTGVAPMDAMIGGLELGELVAINGIPGSGRTAMALDIGLQTVKDTQLPVSFYSQDNSAQQLTRRMLSMLSGVPISCIENAELEDDQWNRLSSAGVWLRDRDIRIREIDCPLSELCTCIRRSDTPALVIIDGLPFDQLTREDMQRLKALARERSCCVLFTGYHHTPSPYITGCADKVFHLERYPQGDTIFEVLWNRNGRRGSTVLTWDEDCLQFLQAVWEDEEMEGK